MYKPNTLKVKEILMNEEGQDSKKIDEMLSNYPPLDESFRKAVDQWLEDRTVDDEVEVEGLKISDVMDNRQYHFLIAVKELNRLLDPNLSDENRKILVEDLKNRVHFE